MHKEIKYVCETQDDVRLKINFGLKAYWKFNVLQFAFV